MTRSRDSLVPSASRQLEGEKRDDKALACRQEGEANLRAAKSQQWPRWSKRRTPSGVRSARADWARTVALISTGTAHDWRGSECWSRARIADSEPRQS